MYVVKQELKSLPLNILHEKVVLAANNIKHSLVELEKAHHAAFIAKKQQEWNETHEAPFEGDWETIYPAPVVDPEVLNRRIADSRREALKEALELLGVKKKSSWLMPQLAAYIAGFKLNDAGEGGRIDGRVYLQENLSKDDWHKGLYLLATVHQRGLILDKQTSPDNRGYCALVPLLMMPHKKMNHIPYARWSNTSLVVDSAIREALDYPGDMPTDVEAILAARDQGLVVKTGAKAGTVRNPVSYHSLHGVADTVLGGMPWLCQVMSSQIWCAHPVNRTSNMILNWKKLDDMPEPLIPISTITNTTTVNTTTFTEDRLPWDI